jgi:hypothetical protein
VPLLLLLELPKLLFHVPDLGVEQDVEIGESLDLLQEPLQILVGLADSSFVLFLHCLESAAEGPALAVLVEKHTF